MAYDALETPFGKTDRILGGAATYIALSASYHVAKSNIVSVVGADFEQQHLDLLSGKGADLEGVQIIPDGKTFFWKGKYHTDMNSRDTLDTQLNVLETFNPIVPEGFKDCKYLMLGNLMPSIQQKVLDQLPNRPKLVVLDTMNFWMDHTLDLLMDVIKKVDVITINDEEARQLSGEYSLVKAAAKIHEMGPAYVVIKKGEHGALLFHDKQVFFAPALPLEEVFDPTGAGDSFAGGFVGYLAQSENISFENMKNAVIHGSNIASFCVEKFGTERLIDLDQQVLKDRLKQFIALTQFNIDLA